MKMCTKKPIQQILALTFIFKMRCQASNSMKKFVRICIAKVARSSNMKCSGMRLEVSESRLAERWLGRERAGMGVTGHCYVHRRLQCHKRDLWEHFPAFL